MQSLLNITRIRFSNPLSRWWVAGFALPLLVIWLSQASPLVGQDLKSMPWMDQDSGELAPVGIETSESAITGDRSLIPIKKVKAKKAAPAKTNTAWTPGGGGGSAGLAAGGPVFVYGLAIAGIVLLAALVVWVFLTSRVEIDAADGFSSRPDRTLEESIRHLPFEMDVEKGDFQQQAQAAYQAGNFRQALVFLFSHVLVTLDQAKLVRLKKGKTNRQYLRELSGNRSLANYYGDVMVPFEQTFFGDYPVTKEVFENCWQGLDKFQTEVDLARAKMSRTKTVLSNVVHSSVGTNVVGVNVAEGPSTHG